MAVVQAFTIPGLKIWFWSDDHEPPHFHVKKSGEREIKVRFLLHPDQMVEQKWVAKPPPSKLLRKICALAEVWRVDLLEQWEETQGN